MASPLPSRNQAPLRTPAHTRTDTEGTPISLAYGPSALTPGTGVQFRIAKNATAVQIRNFSRYFLGVYFGSNPPGGTTTALSPGYHDVIAPGEQPVLAVVGNYTANPALTPNGLSEFTGDVFLQPISVDAGLALTGLPSLNYATLTAYLAGEVLPASTAAPRIVDASNQQRVVAVPMAAVELWQGVAATSINVLGTFNITQGGGFPPQLLADQRAHFYLYWFRAWLTGFGAGSDFADCVIEVYPGDNAGVPIVGVTPQVIHSFEVNSFFGTTTTGFGGFVRDDEFYPTTIPVVFFGWAGNVHVPFGLFARLRCTGQVGGASLHWEGNIDIDYTNDFTSPGTIGNALRDGSNTTPPVVGGSY